MGQTKTQLIGETKASSSAVVEMPTVEPSKKEKKAKVRSQKYQEAKKKIDRNRLYSLKDAVALAKETSTSKFDGTLELHMVVRKEGLSVNVDLPHSTGKAKKVEVADDKTLAKLKDGKVDFDVLLATADMMPKLVPFARILGPKGLMPNPKNGTIIKSAKDAEKFNANSLSVKTEKKAPIIHTAVGKVSMKDTDLVENVEAIFKAVSTRQVQKAYLVASMGPSVKVAVE